MTDTELLEGVSRDARKFWKAIVQRPACQGRTAAEAMEYAATMLLKNEESAHDYQHFESHKLWRSIVAGPACKDRTPGEALGYAEPFVAAEREREDRRYTALAGQWAREEERNHNVLRFVLRSVLYVGAALGFFVICHHLLFRQPLLGGQYFWRDAFIAIFSPSWLSLAKQVGKWVISFIHRVLRILQGPTS